MSNESDAKERLTRALENKSSSDKLDGRIVKVISNSTGVSVARLRQMEQEIMDEEGRERR